MDPETKKKISEIHATVVIGTPSNDRLLQAAQAVVDARHYHGDDGWDRLKNAIGDLEDILTSSKKH